MRNVRALCSLAVVAMAFGCGGSKSGEEAKAPTEPPTQEPAPSGTAVEGQTPPSAGAEPGMTENEPGQAPPQAGTGQAPPAQPPGAGQMQLSSNDLLMGTLSCMLGPVMHTSQMGSSGAEGDSMGAGSPGAGSTDLGSAPGASSDRCMTTAKATNVAPGALYNGEPTAIETVRKALDSRLSAEGASSDAANNTLAFYDKGVAASKEARSAQDAIALFATAAHAMRTRGGSSAPKAGSSGRAGGPSTMTGQTADQIRAHTALSDLYQYGRNLGATESGTQAQALAWVIGANRFMAVNQVPPPAKSLVAEPLFSGLLNVPAPAPMAGRVAPAWNEYLAATARSVSATSSKTGATGQAVGGGPNAANEKANLEQVVKTTEDKLQVLGQQLPFTSPLRSEVDQTLAGLNALEVSAVTAPPATPHKGSAPKKPAPATPKKHPTQ